MKKILLSLFSVALLATISVTFQSCETDPCKDVECGTNGQCFEGDCVCDLGYEADVDGKCNTEQRAKFVATYAVTETCDGVADNYVSGITTSTSGVEKVILTNLYNQNVTCVATISESSKLDIAMQAFGSASITGSGTRNSSGVIALTYTVSLAGQSQTCTATLTPQ